MTTIEELDALLHEGAARSRLQARREEASTSAFFWKVFRAIPQAEAVEGHPDDAEADAHYISQWLGDFFDARDLGDALRPFYVEYLVEHEQG